MTRFIALFSVMVVVMMKNVISRKPRSTIGVRSTLVESFFPCVRDLLPVEEAVFISAINSGLLLR